MCRNFGVDSHYSVRGLSVPSMGHDARALHCSAVGVRNSNWHRREWRPDCCADIRCLPVKQHKRLSYEYGINLDSNAHTGQPIASGDDYYLADGRGDASHCGTLAAWDITQWERK